MDKKKLLYDYLLSQGAIGAIDDINFSVDPSDSNSIEQSFGERVDETRDDK